MAIERYQQILKALEDQLNLLEVEEDILIQSERGIKLSCQALKEIRQKVLTHTFGSAEEEILFFKEIKPRLYSKVIYYVKLFHIESRRPRGSNHSQIAYLNHQIDEVQLFFEENFEFYHYYRRNSCALDQQYFMRGNADFKLYLDNFYSFIDESFCTSHDGLVATILAYDMLIVHLKSEINKLEDQRGKEKGFTATFPNFFWTANKVDLVELIYALNDHGAINHGRASIKELTALFEQLFHIDLGNFYHAFIEIRARKNGRSKFLDALKIALLKRMDEADN